MRIKIGIFLTLGIITAVSILGIYNTNSPAKKETAKETKEISAFIGEKYSDIKELEKKAGEIVEVKVLADKETINYGDMIFTVSKAKVLSSFKGKYKGSEEIKILETGGTTPDGGECSLNGVPLMKAGEKLILFVEKYDGPITKDAYVPLGAYQGKFKIKDDGKVEQQTDKDFKILEFGDTNVEKFKEKIKSELGKDK